MGVARVLFLTDTHLGFDYPFRPRIQRRRRGLDFFANYEKALAPALDGKVDKKHPGRIAAGQRR